MTRLQGVTQASIFGSRCTSYLSCAPHVQATPGCPIGSFDRSIYAKRSASATASRQRRRRLDAVVAVLTFNEVVTVNLLSFIRCDRSNPNIMVDHELGQLLAVYEHDL